MLQKSDWPQQNPNLKLRSLHLTIGGRRIINKPALARALGQLSTTASTLRKGENDSGALLDDLASRKPKLASSRADFEIQPEELKKLVERAFECSGMVALSGSEIAPMLLSSTLEGISSDFADSAIRQQVAEDYFKDMNSLLL